MFDGQVDWLKPFESDASPRPAYRNNSTNSFSEAPWQTLDIGSKSLLSTYFPLIAERSQTGDFTGRASRNEFVEFLR